MNLSSIRIILVATSHPGNIGSTARAMKNMGLSELYLVNPKLFPHQKADEMAAGSDDILQNCKLTDSLEAALAGCHLVMATSARSRDLALPELTPAGCAELIHQQADNTQVAIVFGREHAGLTNQELAYCHYHVHIPSNPQYSSLNLSQAVQIMTYELRIKSEWASTKTTLPKDSLATVDEVERFYAHLKNLLLAIDFLKPDNPGRLEQRIRRLFNRARLEQTEVNILRGILSHIQDAL